MVTCAADGCCNTSVKGSKMIYFPKNPHLRSIWIKNSGLDPGKINKFSALCEFHFPMDMWEKPRADGSKKLKANAVPVIFGDLVIQTRKHMRNLQLSSKPEQQFINESRESSRRNINILSKSKKLKPHTVPPIFENLVAQEHETNGHRGNSLSSEPPQLLIDVSIESSSKNVQILSADYEKEQISHQVSNCHYNSKKDSGGTSDSASNSVASSSDKAVEEESITPRLQDKFHSEHSSNPGYIGKLEEKIEKLEKFLMRSESIRRAMKKRHKLSELKLKKTIKKLEERVRMHQNFPRAVTNLLSEDQIHLLNRDYKKIPKWCDATLVKAYQLKFACGISGYKELLRQGFPLPSSRTLSRKLENFKFQSGILEEVFIFLDIKVSQFKHNRDKDCLIVLDEIAITPGTVFDTSTYSYVGTVTLPTHDSTAIATQGLVFMVAGIGHRWKQVVAYYYTTKSTNGFVYKDIILEIIEKAENIGLFVHGIVSDMGSANQAMWRAFNINASRYSTIQNKCAHPFDDDRYLYFFHDSSHAFKNLKEGMINHQVVRIPQMFTDKYNLPNKEVRTSHFHDLLEEHNNQDSLVLAPKLNEKNLDHSKHFQKMRVKNASHVLSFEVSSALNYLAEEKSTEEYKTTAWFVGMIEKWFTLVSSRKLALAISKKNTEKYSETMEFLNEFIDLISSLSFGSNSSWKPFQTGIIITTQSFIDLANYLIDEKNYDFVFGGRFTQDCIENLFSCLRVKNELLNALQFKNNLKLVTISQYIKHISSGNYNIDDREFLPGFLTTICNLKNDSSKQNSSSDELPTPSMTADEITLTRIELNILYNICGYIVSSITKNQTVCEKCVRCVGSRKVNLCQYNRLTIHRKRADDTLFFVNQNTFDFFVQMEKFFRSYQQSLTLNRKINLKRFFVTKFQKISYAIPDCHKLKQKIIERFSVFRLKIHWKKIRSPKANTYASKTMAMHNRVH